MRLKDWAKKEGISYLTAWRWCDSGKMPVPFRRTPTGLILVDEPENESHSSKKEVTAVYCRVSTHEKKDDLNRQMERCEQFCRARGWVIDIAVKEIASGMNDNRPKLKKLFDKKPTRLVVEYKDRLTRFGFNYFEYLLPKLGCELIVINRDHEQKDDMTKDLISVVTSFCCRLYGLRSARNKLGKIKEVVNEPVG